LEKSPFRGTIAGTSWRRHEMTVKEAAKRLEISASLCYELIAEGRLPCRRIGRRGRRGKIIIRDEDIETFLKSVKVVSK
jgi:excisionase family DNA binding protein